MVGCCVGCMQLQALKNNSLERKGREGARRTQRKAVAAVAFSFAFKDGLRGGRFRFEDAPR